MGILPNPSRSIEEPNERLVSTHPVAAEARKSRLFLRAAYRKRYALRSKLGTFMRSPFLRAD